MYRFETEPTKDENSNYFIDLPCNCDIIESVTADYEDYQKTTPTTITTNNMSGWVESYVESRKFNTGTLYQSGKFIKYYRVNNTLYLSDKFQKVKILYKGVIADETGLPYINEKEIDAIAAFCAYSNLFKQALKTKDSSTFQMAQYMEQK